MVIYLVTFLCNQRMIHIPVGITNSVNLFIVLKLKGYLVEFNIALKVFNACRCQIRTKKDKAQ